MPAKSLPRRAVERFGDRLLARDLPALPAGDRARTVRFVGDRVDTLPGPTKLSVGGLAVVVDVVGRLVGSDRLVGALAGTRLPLVAEYPRFVRSLGYAFVWETWPDTAADGSR